MKKNMLKMTKEKSDSPEKVGEDASSGHEEECRDADESDRYVEDDGFSMIAEDQSENEEERRLNRAWSMSSFEIYDHCVGGLEDYNFVHDAVVFWHENWDQSPGEPWLHWSLWFFGKFDDGSESKEASTSDTDLIAEFDVLFDN